ncbi:MAG TPA: hypothetical protein VNC50_06940 [Planctomycetia bacterium]|nr:hypothetical protein [Planctomycetia bacterium]
MPDAGRCLLCALSLLGGACAHRSNAPAPIQNGQLAEKLLIDETWPWTSHSPPKEESDCILAIRVYFDHGESEAKVEWSVDAESVSPAEIIPAIERRRREAPDKKLAVKVVHPKRICTHPAIAPTIAAIRTWTDREGGMFRETQGTSHIRGVTFGRK